MTPIDGMSATQGLDTQRLRSEAEQRNPGELGKDDFLLLLTTQLQQQDPLDPTDNAEFVAQLSQFASLERLENMSSSMNNLAISQTANTSAQVVSFIGRRVRVSGDEFALSKPGQSVDLYAQLPENASRVDVVVKDDTGSVVRVIDAGAAESGENTFAWDGLRNDGTPAAPGTYTFEVQAYDDTDTRIEGVATSTFQDVQGVSFEGGFPMLVLDSGVEATLGDVMEVSADETP